MANVFYALVQRRNPLKKDAPKLYYAAAQKNGNFSFEAIKRRIAQATMATEADVSHIVESLISVISEGLKNGQSVFLDKFGQFRLSFSSKGAKTMKEFTPEMIHRLHIVFHPCKELRVQKNELSFEQKTTVTEQRAALKAKIEKGGSNTGGNTSGNTGGNTGGDKPGDESMD